MSDETSIRRAAVLGAGVMGAAIAAHLANAGVPTLLLDLPSDTPPDQDPDPRWRNRIAGAGLQKARKGRPAAFFSPQDAALVEIGNFEDDLARLAEADWVIEAVIENLEIKKELFAKLSEHLAPKAILSSNTSGLSVASLAAILPPELRPRFLGTHFFNPPRYLKLLELIPGPETDPEVFQRIATFGEASLGKGIVHAKDTPNFVANRIGCFTLFHAMNLMAEEGYSVQEVDYLTGPLIGRPKSATFRTADVVGLDTLLLVAQNSYHNLPDDPCRHLYQPPAFMEAMQENGWLGEKSGRGFYQKVGRGKDRQIRMIDPGSMDYVEQGKLEFPEIEQAKGEKGFAARLAKILASSGRGASFLWRNLADTFHYTASLIPEISDDVLQVDRAMRWGFGWKLGPFELWDALGFTEICSRMEAEGMELPAMVRQLLDSGRTSFYARIEHRPAFFDRQSAEYKSVPAHPRILSLQECRQSRGVILENAEASLVDLGDEVACLEFHSKMNTLGPGSIQMIQLSLDRVESEFRGLVIANEADHFSAGANLAMVLESIGKDDFQAVDDLVRLFQQTAQRIRFSSRPVVVAPRGMTLGGGCEISLAADARVAAAESYIGLPEVGAGVIPAGGGCKEMLKRLHQRLPELPHLDLGPFIQALFQVLGMAKISSSARMAQNLGFLAQGDGISMNGDYLLEDAKRRVLALDLQGYRPGRPLEDIRVAGRDGYAALQAAIYNMAAGGFATEYDQVVGGKLAFVLCGGDVSPGTRVSETYLLDLEHQAFLELCRDSRTQARMAHILKTGKPLRN
ncbi:MAG: 3-hydroxyacyl-CoA dehydrogenase/enoyl-CoA hydratase family protein [Planctomycetota bacterium]|nr:MAG: 3-hydroxyacyl-CoA dehydrogenase/enoyl-CoA hydratase family protein [Planctomycetota bacterium]